jgi:hypothetical protein
MKVRWFVFGVVAAVACALPVTVQAQTFSENFDSYAAGSGSSGRRMGLGQQAGAGLRDARPPLPLGRVRLGRGRPGAASPTGCMPCLYVPSAACERHPSEQPRWRPRVGRPLQRSTRLRLPTAASSTCQPPVDNSAVDSADRPVGRADAEINLVAKHLHR